MWATITGEISKTLGASYLLTSKTQISGGDTNQCFKISDGAKAFFVKINHKSSLSAFECEKFSLDHLHRFFPGKVPHVITAGRSLNNSFLVLEYLPLTSAQNSHWLELGQNLAKLHQTSIHQEFGWDHENFIGKSPQVNRWHKCWASFFAEQRIGWQLQLLHEQGIHVAPIEATVAIVKQILKPHRPSPCLVHGDLWQGNIGFVGEQATIFDAACYYGDREVDIAMTELFGKLPDAFYQAYHSAYPLSDGYQQRKDLYNLYHLLNHATLFKGVYIDQAKHRIKHLPDML